MHTLQKFSSVHASFHNHFGTERHLTGRDQFKAHRFAVLAEWKALAASLTTPPALPARAGDKLPLV